MPELTPTVYVPIEESNRELHSKLLVTGELLKKSVTVILGRQPMMIGNLPFVPPGVVLFKGMNAMPAYLMHRLPDYGHVSVATDEEVLGLADAFAMSRIMDATIGPVCDKFFAQGQFHADAMAKYIPESAAKIRVVGNARIDLLREPFRERFVREAEEHRAAYGDYVLIDTNLGRINSRWGGSEEVLNVLERVGWLDRNIPQDMEYHNLQIRTEQANVIILRRTLEQLSDLFPKRNFVIRPHPSEREEPWRQAYENYPNVHVTKEGTHVPWLLGSDLMFHTGCTTGLEAEILGVPCMSLLPIEHETLTCSNLLSHQANHCAIGIDEAIATARDFLLGEKTPIVAGRKERLAELAVHVAAMEGPFAYQRVAREILEMLAPVTPRDDFDWVPLDGNRFISNRGQFEARVSNPRGADYSWSKVEIDKLGLEATFADLNGAMGPVVMPEISEVAEGMFKFRPRR